jgi:hypothetical protein
MIAQEELLEILEYYKAGYKNAYANQDIERLVNEIFRLRKEMDTGYMEKSAIKIKKIKKE